MQVQSSEIYISSKKSFIASTSDKCEEWSQYNAHNLVTVLTRSFLPRRNAHLDAAASWVQSSMIILLHTIYFFKQKFSPFRSFVPCFHLFIFVRSKSVYHCWHRIQDGPNAIWLWGGALDCLLSTFYKFTKYILITIVFTTLTDWTPVDLVRAYSL